jgi:hypothetical protein
MAKITGGCLCGKVTFELENEFRHFHLCHCTHCQKTTGSAHAFNLFTDQTNITWLSGKDLIKRYDVPDRMISKAFCSECGCGVPYISKSGKSLVVPAGSLNESHGMLPQDNIFWSERADWYDAALEEAKQFPE